MRKKISHKAKHVVKKHKATISIFRINMYTTGLVFSIALFAFTLWAKQLPPNNTVLGAQTTPQVITPSVTPTPSPANIYEK